jgi:hypothetical protein
MALTEFHIVLLYSDRIAAMSILNESLVYEEILPLVSTEPVDGNEADFAKETRGDSPCAYS